MLGRLATLLGSVEVPGRRIRSAPSRGATPTKPQSVTKSRATTDESRPEPEGGGKSTRLNLALVFLLFVSLAIIQTWPLVLHMSDHAMGWPGDSYVMWWNFAWVKESLFSLSNPFYTDALYYPEGSDLYLHTLIPVNAVVSIPLQMITGGNILLTWNIMSLVFIALSGTGGYALSYHVTKERWLSLIGGVIFAFAPHVMMQLNGHLNIATTWPIPFFALFLLRFFEGRSKVDLVLVAILGALLTWNWFEFAIDVGLLAVFAFCFWALPKLRRGQRSEVVGLVRSLLPGVALWAALSAPILIPTVLAFSSGAYSLSTGSSEAVYYSPDLFAYVIPSPLWGPGEHATNFGEPFATRSGGIETTMFLGFTPLLLSIVAFLYRRKSALRGSIVLWSFVFAFFAVMALGPWLHVLGMKLSIPMPFRLLQEIPLIGERRVPGRMIIVGMLALGVLSTIGASLLARNLAGKGRYAVPIITCVVLALVFFEYWSPPVNLASYNTPAVYEEIGRESGDFAVLDLPLGRVTGNLRQGDAIGGALTDYAQVIHGKSAIGGYLSRVEGERLDWLAEQPGLGYLSCLDCDGYPRSLDLDGERVRAFFTELQIKYTVVNLVTFEGEPTTLVTEGQSAEVQRYLTETIGLQDAGSGDGWVAYRNPDVE